MQPLSEKIRQNELRDAVHMTKGHVKYGNSKENIEMWETCMISVFSYCVKDELGGASITFYE